MTTEGSLTALELKAGSVPVLDMPHASEFEVSRKRHLACHIAMARQVADNGHIGAADRFRIGRNSLRVRRVHRGKAYVDIGIGFCGWRRSLSTRRAVHKHDWNYEEQDERDPSEHHSPPRATSGDVRGGYALDFRIRHGSLRKQRTEGALAAKTLVEPDYSCLACASALIRVFVP